MSKISYIGTLWKRALVAMIFRRFNFVLAIFGQGYPVIISANFKLT